MGRNGASKRPASFKGIKLSKVIHKENVITKSKKVTIFRRLELAELPAKAPKTSQNAKRQTSNVER
jgi:hypothetical protein